MEPGQSVENVNPEQDTLPLQDSPREPKEEEGPAPALCGPIWLSAKARARLTWALLLLQLGVLGGVFAVIATCYTDYEAHGEVTLVFGGGYYTKFTLAFTMVTCDVALAAAALEVLAIQDLDAPNEPTAGTLRWSAKLAGLLQPAIVIGLLSSAFLFSPVSPNRLAEGAVLRFELQRRIRDVALGRALPAVVAEINFLQAHYRCCGLEEAFVNDTSPHRPLEAWLRGVWVAGRSWDVPWSCCDPAAAGPCAHADLGFGLPWRPAVDAGTLAARLATVHQRDCGAAVLDHTAASFERCSLACAWLGLVVLVGWLGGRLLKTSTRAAVWEQLDGAKAAPGFVLWSSSQGPASRPAFEVAAFATALRLLKAELRGRQALGEGGFQGMVAFMEKEKDDATQLSSATREALEKAAAVAPDSGSPTLETEPTLGDSGRLAPDTGPTLN